MRLRSLSGDLRAFVRDLSADKLSPRAAPCVFLGFPPDAPGWQFYHPTSRRVLSSQDVTFDESVPYYRLFPYRNPSFPPPPLFLVPGPPPGRPPSPSGSCPFSLRVLRLGVLSLGVLRLGVLSLGGATTGGAEPGGATPGGAEPGGADPEGAGPARVTSGGAVPGGVLLELEVLRLLRVLVPRVPEVLVLGVLELLGLRVLLELVPLRLLVVRLELELLRVLVLRLLLSVLEAVLLGVLLELLEVLELEVLLALVLPLGVVVLSLLCLEPLRGLDRTSFRSLSMFLVSRLLLVLLLPESVHSLSRYSYSYSRPPHCPALSPYTGPTGGLGERREPASRPALRVRAARTSGRGLRQRPPPVPGTHRMSLRPSTAPLHAPLPSPPESSLPALADPESDSLRAASPTVTRLLATVVTDPSFESTAASALVAELVDFAARCRLDYAVSLVAESESVCPPSVGGECALGTNVLEDRQEEFQCLAAASPHLVSVLLTPEGDPDALDIPTPRSYAEAIEGPYSSQWQAAMDAEMAS
ncbi:unnamed protein product [Closterium sp. NIES-64]|nr:unnamed protein product [Closterium sp. NIES-64]